MNLLKVELTRLRWRRAALLILLAAVVLPIIFIAATAWNTRPLSDADIADARSQLEMNQQYQQESVDDCVAHPRQNGLEPDDPKLEEVCRDMFLFEDDISNYLYRDQLSTPYALEGPGLSTAVFMVLLAMILGTTFAGADWASGSMSNQLLFESRRARLWLAKAAAAAIGGVVLAVVGSAVFWSLYAGLAAIRDVPLAGSGDDVGALALRSLLFAGGAALMGFAVTMLFRSTVACLGLLLAGAIGGSILMSVLPFDDPERWMFHSNAAAVLQDGYEYWPRGDYICDMGDCSDAMVTLSLAHGVVYYAVLLAIVSALSIASFRRRDVP
ncbi:ABC transporter permease subunit [Nocardioides sp. JQ2195]|uniref:ABC transporter permease subunit n=1 Tax=Nocardioides sp. JQ2195 TaxID=2592334 RepID=UPI00143EF2C4|nr:ABC transporter permease subunit [Nocardioides sp. JQ2195]QIX27052.1 ABC transporter permease subunit [Nocardioides sp. JQ2195]